MYGHTTNIGIGFQNSFDGVANVSSLFWVPFVSEGVGLNIPPLISQANRGIHDEGEHYAGPKTVDGDLVIEAQPIVLGALLKAAFGQPTTVKADSAAVYTHTFVASPSSDFDYRCAKRPVTIIKNFDVGCALEFTNMNVNTIELSIANGEFLTVTAGFVGGNFKQRERIAPSFPTGKRWTWDQASATIGNFSNGDVANLTMSIEDSLEAQHTLGNEYPSRIKRTGFRITNVSGTLKFENQDEFQAFIGQEERILSVAFTGAVDVSSGYKSSLVLQLPLLRHTEFKPVAGGPGAIEASFTSKGIYSVNSGYAARVILVNTQTVY